MASTPSFSHDASRQDRHESVISAPETLITGLIFVNQGKVAIIETFGKFQEIAKPGFNLYPPLFTTATQVYLRTVYVDTPPQEVLTKDVQKLVVDGGFHYRILDPKKAVYHVQNLEDSLIALFYRSVITSIGQMDNKQAISLNRDQFALEIRDRLNAYLTGKKDGQIEKQTSSSDQSEDDMADLGREQEMQVSRQHSLDLQPSLALDRSWGVQVTMVAITKITYPVAIVKSMEEQRQAELNRKTLELQTEAEKRQITIRAEASKLADQLGAEAKAVTVEVETNIQLKTAQAESEAKLIRARAEAEAEVIRARAEAEKQKLIGEAYNANPTLANIEALRIAADAMTRLTTSPNSKVFFMNPGDKNNFLTQLMAMQELSKTTTPEGAH